MTTYAVIGDVHSNPHSLAEAFRSINTYNGHIDKINVFSPGKDYNIVDPPNVGVADSVGSGIESIVHFIDDK